MGEMGKGADEVELERFGLMRYSGQWLHSLVVRIPPGELTDEALQAVVDDFRSIYDSLYGHGAGLVSQGVELFTVRVHAVVRLRRPAQAVQEELREDHRRGRADGRSGDLLARPHATRGEQGVRRHDAPSRQSGGRARPSWNCPSRPSRWPADRCSSATPSATSCFSLGRVGPVTGSRVRHGSAGGAGGAERPDASGTASPAGTPRRRCSPSDPRLRLQTAGGARGRPHHLRGHPQQPPEHQPGERPHHPEAEHLADHHDQPRTSSAPSSPRRATCMFLGPYLMYLGNTLGIMTKWVLENRSESPGIEDGDVFLNSDPYVGSSHQAGHRADLTGLLGGRALLLGGQLGPLQRRWRSGPGELLSGLRAPSGRTRRCFPPFKLVERGRVRADMEQLWLRQSRVPATSRHGPARRSCRAGRLPAAHPQAARALRCPDGQGGHAPDARRRGASASWRSLPSSPTGAGRSASTPSRPSPAMTAST